MATSRSRITAWLERVPAGVMNGYAVASAFAVYFFVFAFRKPFTAATFDGLHFGGTQIELKTAFVVSQIIGYTLAKYLGIKVCSEASRGRRVWMLVGLVVLAELALVLFAVVPLEWKVAAMLLNGLPLGIVWGLVVRYLEGRRTSDFLLAGLACSFIVASGVFKDIGRAVMAGNPMPLLGVELPNPLGRLSEFWMPAATGLCIWCRVCWRYGYSIRCRSRRWPMLPSGRSASRWTSSGGGSFCGCICRGSCRWWRRMWC